MDYSKPHTLEEWIQFYEDKTKDKFELPQGMRLMWLPHRGFMVVAIDLNIKVLLIYLTCGDGKFWRDVAEMLALNNGLTKLMTICTRKIEPYIRFWRWKITDKQEKDGQIRYFCKDDMDRDVLVTHRGVDEKSGQATYYVTQYLIKGERPEF